LRHDGVIAPSVFDGAINGEAFLAYVEQILVPALRPGDTVIMDNLSSHKVTGVRTANRSRGSVFAFPPPYSPDLNPIEMLFAKFQGPVAINRSGERSRPRGTHSGNYPAWSTPRNAPTFRAMPDISSQREDALTSQ